MPRALIVRESEPPAAPKPRLLDRVLLAEVLRYLRSQVQLVIGYAATTSDLHAFLKSNGVEP